MATSELSIQYIERILECAICLERFRTPKILPCQHTFCCECLVGLVDARRKVLRCPNCRSVHRIPQSGVEGLPNNLTITALLDIPTTGAQQKPNSENRPMASTGAESPEKIESSEKPDPCAECGSVAHLASCFHCARLLCPTCKECHRKTTQLDINGDLHQLKQKIAKLSTSLQGVQLNINRTTRTAESSKTKVYDVIDTFCRELREQGNIIANQIDNNIQTKVQVLQTKAKCIELHIAEMESFHNFSVTKMNQDTNLISDSELVEARNQCFRFLGKSTKESNLASGAPNRRPRTAPKGKHHSRSSSGNRSNIQRPSMRRLQSFPDIVDTPTDQNVIEPARPASSFGGTLPESESVVSTSQSSPPKYTIGDRDIPSAETRLSPRDVMDTAENETIAWDDMAMDVIDNTFPMRASDQEQLGQGYTGIVVKTVIGKRGARFWNPSAICISPTNATIIVLDSYKNCVQVLDRDGHFVTSFGSSGSSDGKFDYPSACVCNKDGHIVITDAFNHRVQILDKYGVFLGKFGQCGSETGCFEGPSGIAVDSNGYIYVADTNNNRIQVFDQAGGHVHTFGTPEAIPAHLQSPRYSSLAISQDGEVFVSDGKNHCVHIFNIDGTYCKSIGRQGSGLAEFSSPRGLVLNHYNQLLVADRDNHRIQVFLQSGEFQYCFGSQGERAGQFHGPEGLALADNGDIVVAECGGQRVQIFTASSSFQ